MASASALLKDSFSCFSWVGFYLPASDGSLVVGPYQGPLACDRIPAGRGVCGACFSSGQTVVVADVHAIDDHIACDSNSRSEIVVPVRSEGETLAVLDVDSTDLDAFGDEDRVGLEHIACILAAHIR